MNSAPSLVALSWLGRHVSPGLAGVGIPGHVALDVRRRARPRVDAEVPRGARRARPARDVLHARRHGAPRTGAGGRRRRGRARGRGPRRPAPLAAPPDAAASSADDIARARDAVADATGVAAAVVPTAVRHAVARRVAWRARRVGLRTVLWTAWGRDWRAEATPESVVGDVLDGYVDGGTVLLHDSDCTSAPDCWHATLGALPALAAELDARSLRVGPVGEHGIPRPDPSRGVTAPWRTSSRSARASVTRSRRCSSTAWPRPRRRTCRCRRGCSSTSCGTRCGCSGSGSTSARTSSRPSRSPTGRSCSCRRSWSAACCSRCRCRRSVASDRPGRKDWIAAAAVAGGIAVFLSVGDPSDGHGRATPLDWVIAFSICGSIIVAMIIATRKAPPHYRALGLAVATGACVRAHGRAHQAGRHDHRPPRCPRVCSCTGRSTRWRCSRSSG